MCGLGWGLQSARHAGLGVRRGYLTERVGEGRSPDLFARTTGTYDGIDGFRFLPEGNVNDVRGLMRISRVQVTGLFGVFDHDVPIRRGERVTIIAGPNGYGKTILLRLIDAVFNGNNHTLRSVPFARLEIEFDDGSSLVMHKSPGGRPSSRAVVFALRSPGQEQRDWTLPSVAEQRHGMPPELFERYVPGLERIERELWSFAPTGEVLGIEDVVDRFGEIVAPTFGDAKPPKKPEWLNDIRSQVHVRLIETQRLQRAPVSASRARGSDASASRWAVTVYANDLAVLIQAKLAEYAKTSQALDRTFPARVVARQVPVEVSGSELKQELADVEKRRADLTEAGLLGMEAGPEFAVLAEIQNEMKPVIAVWIDDVKAKLDVFNDLAARTKLLTRVINSRFLYKEMVIDSESGFTFRTTAGEPISPDLLSSGEQHELVLMYELLFKVERPALIMIDEPELSLHVAWQKAFLGDLQQAAGLGDFDVILATHSPQIIGDRYDVTVELEGPPVGNATTRHA